MIHALASHASVVVLVLSAAAFDHTAASGLGAASVEHYARDLRGVRRRIHAVRHRVPLSSAGAWSFAAARRVRELTALGGVVIAEHARTAPYHQPGSRWVLSLHNVDSELATMLTAQGSTAAQRLWGLRDLEARYERRMLQRIERAAVADPNATVIVVSHRDQSVIGDRSRVVPNGTDVPAAVTEPARGGDVLFVGSMDYPPNAEAVDWWASDVWPRLHEPRPRLVVAGRFATDVLGGVDRERVRVVGEVDHVAPLLERARVVAVPLRSGGGTRLKILEALAFGRPVVTTTKGAEGLSLADGTVVVADDAEGFAAAIERVLDDDELARELSRRGRAAVVERSWTVVGDRFARDLVEEFSR